MKKFFIIFLISIMMPLSVFADASMETVTVATVSIGFTASVINPSVNKYATRAMCTLESGQIRFTYDDKTIPTTTVGHLLEIGQNLNLIKYDQIRSFRGIRTGSTSGSLICTYEFD